MGQAVIYPRGFLGFDIGLPIQDKSKDLNNILDSVKLNKQISTKSDLVISNVELENLWNQYKTGDRFIASFAFREQILKTSLESFGTDSFYEFCKIQTQSPYFTEMHRRFMNDTFNFITTGKRTLNIFSWMKLIECKEPKTNDDQIAYTYDQFFGTNKPLNFRRDVSVVNAVQSWVSNVNGFDDMLGTLHIFFGDQEKA